MGLFRLYPIPQISLFSVKLLAYIFPVVKPSPIFFLLFIMIEESVWNPS